jgi:hypothetical protein
MKGKHSRLFFRAAYESFNSKIPHQRGNSNAWFNELLSTTFNCGHTPEEIKAPRHASSAALQQKYRAGHILMNYRGQVLISYQSGTTSSYHADNQRSSVDYVTETVNLRPTFNILNEQYINSSY